MLRARIVLARADAGSVIAVAALTWRHPRADRTADSSGPVMSGPVSSRRSFFGEDALEGPVPGWVVGYAVAPAVPDDVQPGAGEDADGVGVVFAAGDGVAVEPGCPGAGAAGVAGEVADGVAQLLVAAQRKST